MAAFTWTGQTTAAGDETIASDGYLSFFGTDHGDGITISTYQDSTHVEPLAKTDQCDPHISNCKWLTANTISIQGGGSVALSTLTEAQCTLEIHFDHGSSVAITNCLFIIHGATEGVNPSDVTVKGAEQGDTDWTDCGGADDDLTLGDKSAATDHYWYLPISVSPTTIGEKDTNFTMKCSLTYQ